MRNVVVLSELISMLKHFIPNAINRLALDRPASTVLAQDHFYSEHLSILLTNKTHLSPVRTIIQMRGRDTLGIAQADEFSFARSLNR